MPRKTDTLQAKIVSDMNAVMLFAADTKDKLDVNRAENRAELEPGKWRLVWATLDSHKPFRDFVYCTLGGSGAPMYVKASGKPVFDALENSAAIAAPAPM